MSNDITGGLRNLKGGSIDALRGPYPTVAAANLAIPNTIVDGINFREGKFVDIGSAPNFTAHWWKGGYEDSNLIEYISGNLPDGFTYTDIDRPDLINRTIVVDNNGLEVSSDTLYLSGLQQYDRPDMPIAFIDRDNYLIHSISVKKVQDTAVKLVGMKMVYNPNTQESFTPNTLNWLNNLDLFNQKWNTLTTDFPVNPDLEKYVIRSVIGKTSKSNFDIYRFDFKPKKPICKVILQTGMHASEKVYPKILYDFCRSLADPNQWTKNQTLTWLRNNVHFIVLPMISPSCFRGIYGDRRGGRRVYECEDFPVSWTKTGNDVTVTFNASDFPDTDGRLDANTYFSDPGVPGKTQVALFLSSDLSGLPNDGYVIKSVLNGRTIVVTTPTNTGATQGTARMYVGTDINRNMAATASSVWELFTPSTAENSKTKYDTDQVAYANDNKGTKAFSLSESRCLRDLYTAEMDTTISALPILFIVDMHNGSGRFYHARGSTYKPINIDEQLESLRYFAGQFTDEPFTRFRVDAIGTPFYSNFVGLLHSVMGATIEWADPVTLTEEDATNAMRWMVNVITSSLGNQ